MKTIIICDRISNVSMAIQLSCFSFITLLRTLYVSFYQKVVFSQIQMNVYHVNFGVVSCYSVCVRAMSIDMSLNRMHH